MRISASPVRGPLPIQRRSVAHLYNDTAIVRRTPTPPPGRHAPPAPRSDHGPHARAGSVRPPGGGSLPGRIPGGVDARPDGRRLGIASRKRTTSSALNTIGSLLGSRIGDALRHRGLAERHAIEEPQGTDDLVQRRPRDPRGNQMNLEGMDIFQA